MGGGPYGIGWRRITADPVSSTIDEVHVNGELDAGCIPVPISRSHRWPKLQTVSEEPKSGIPVMKSSTGVLSPRLS